jgi:hypothetical protein
LAKRPSSSSPSVQNREGEGGGSGGGRPAAIAGEPGPSGGRAVGQNDEGFTGDRFPYLPWAVVARGGSSLGGGGLGGGGLEATVLLCLSMGRRWPWWCVAVRGAASSFL